MKRLSILCLSVLMSVSTYCQVENYNHGTLHTLTSKTLNQERKIAIRLPSEYQDTEEMYPVIYVLDGEWNFHFISAAIAKLESSGDVPKLIVVGILNNNRNLDLTPPGTSDNPSRFGGGENFLQFLSNELRPWVEKEFRVRPYSILAGHSFGGLFTIYSMMQKPGLFQSFIALSPSLGRNDEQQIKKAHSFFNQSGNLPARLYMAIGNENGYTKISSLKFKHLVDNRQPSNLEFRFEQLLDEDHVSITTTGFINGLKYIYDGYNANKLRELDDLFLVESHYQDLSNKFGYSIQVPESSYQQFLNEQIANRDFDYASFILNKYESNYPNSPYLKAHLAEYNLLTGDFSKAKQHLQYLKQSGMADQRIDLLISNLKDF